jgi:chromate transporter
MPGTPSGPLPVTSTVRPHPGLRDLFVESLILGVVGFGGGMSVLGQLGHVATRKRRWLTDREYANTATVAQMLPGGAAANALALIGLRYHGVRGALVAYTGFVAPGALAIIALAWAYVRFGIAPRAESILGGFNAAVVGIVGALTISMTRAAVQRGWQMAVAAGALLLGFGGGASAGEVVLLGIGAGLVVDLAMKRARLARWRRVPHKPSPPVALPDEGEPLSKASEQRPGPRPPALALFPVAFGPAGAGALLGLGLLLLRTGLGAYGGGFAIIPSLRATLVPAWIDAHQFTAAVAVGKLTPGPVLLLATFIGYVVHGLPGALVATVAIFAGPFVLVIALGTWLARMRSRRPVRAALRGLTPAVVGLMAAAGLTLGSGLSGGAELAIAGATLLTLTRFKVNPALLLVLGGAARFALRLAGI